MRTKNTEFINLIEDFVTSYFNEYNHSPSLREIEEGTKIPKSTAQRYLVDMRDEGRLEFSGRRTVVSAETRKNNLLSIKVPVLGPVSCGIPKYAEENIEEYVQLPVSLFGKGDFYILRANGDSMIEAGIEDNDLVLIRHQNHANPGQIVVALMEDEATLKRIYPEPENSRIRLHPENSMLSDIYVDDCIIQGVAVKVLKDLT